MVFIFYYHFSNQSCSTQHLRAHAEAIHGILAVHCGTLQPLRHAGSAVLLPTVRTKMRFRRWGSSYYYYYYYWQYPTTRMHVLMEIVLFPSHWQPLRQEHTVQWVT